MYYYGCPRFWEGRWRKLGTCPREITRRPQTGTCYLGQKLGFKSVRSDSSSKSIRYLEVFCLRRCSSSEQIRRTCLSP